MKHGSGDILTIHDTRHLRVVFVSDAVCGRNGVGTYYQDLVTHLAPRLAHVQLIAPCVDIPQAHQSFSFPLPGDTTQRLYWPKRGALARQLRQADPDVVVFPAIGPYTFFGIQEVRRMGRPVWVVQHTDFDRLAQLYFHPLIAAFSRPILQSLNDRVLHWADAIATVNGETAQGLSSRGFGDVRVLATPVAADFFESPPQPSRHEIQRVLFVGRLAKEKNVDQIMQAAREMPHLQFSVAGDGPLRRRVELESEERANFDYVGWLNRRDVIGLIDESDLLVLPSSIESFGTVALEAMARGRLVLVSQHCGIRSWPNLADCLSHCQVGESLAAAIQRVAEMPSRERNQIAQRSRFAAISANGAAIDDWLSMFAELPRRSNPRLIPSHAKQAS